MQRRRLFAGDDRAGLVDLRLAKQRAGVGYARLFQFIFQNCTRIACTILYRKGQRQRIGALRQAAGKREAVKIPWHDVQLTILRIRGAFRQRADLAEHGDRVVGRYADKR